MEILALAPNAARKMLEGFLSFRFPAKLGNFDDSMRLALQNADSATRIRVTKYLHAYSHNEEGDIGKPLEPGEATVVLASVFELMHFLDKDHFDSMCEALDLDAGAVLGAAGALENSPAVTS